MGELVKKQDSDAPHLGKEGFGYLREGCVPYGDNENSIGGSCTSDSDCCPVKTGITDVQSHCVTYQENYEEPTKICSFNECKDYGLDCTEIESAVVFSNVGRVV